jgi:hypothetical protein
MFQPAIALEAFLYMNRHFSADYDVLYLVAVVPGLVLGRFRESIPDDSIRLAIFAGEREDSSKKSRNRFRLVTNPKPKLSKKRAFKLKFAEKASMKPNFFQLFHIS